MRLEKLILRNFKGIKTFTFKPEGQSADIFGANETGKTTVYDAFTYLLTGKDSRDRSPDSFGIKTRNDKGEVVHGLNHEVEGHFSNGIVLKRTYTEKWTRKRGASKEEFSGHTTDYHVNGVPVKASEYQEEVEEIISEELLKMLTMPDYFPEQMHWTDRRQVLFDLAGDIETEDIISNYTDLERYPDVIGDRTHEQQEKVLKKRKRDLNDDLDSIPDRIDELHNRLYDDIGDVSEGKETVESLKKKKETIEAKRSEVKSGGSVADLKVKRQELQAEKQKAKNKHQQEIADSLSGKRKKVRDLQNKVDEAESGWRSAKREYETLEDRLAEKQQNIASIKDEIESIKDREPKPASDFGPDVCPVCERPMEDDEEHDYEAYLEEFNEKKANDIKGKKIELQEAEDEAETVAAQLEIAKDKASKANGKLSQRKQALEKAETALKETKQNQPGFSNEEIDQKIEEIDEKIANHRQEKQSQLEALQKEIANIDERIDEAQETIHKARENKRDLKRISELKEERDKVATELDQVESDLHLMEEFVRARSAYVTDKVNEKFKHVNWRLFKEQINGGIDECCDAIYKGVPFDEGLNNAGRIQAGLDIINTLSEHYGKSVPVFVDNAESVTELPDTDLQVIRLVVSPEHQTLTVETVKKKAVA